VIRAFQGLYGQGPYGMRGRIVSIGGGGGVTWSARGATGGGGPTGPG